MKKASAFAAPANSPGQLRVSMVKLSTVLHASFAFFFFNKKIKSERIWEIKYRTSKLNCNSANQKVKEMSKKIK